MLISAGEMRGYGISALDGNIGHVQDFYFDDFTWDIRYMVVDTGTWLPGRKVLISPEAIRLPDWGVRVVPVSLSREKIEESPSIKDDEPVSRQHEIDLIQYYGWASYWSVPAGAAALTGGGPRGAEKSRKASDGDPNLRSIRAVRGYQVWSADEKVGHVEDFIIGTDDWTIKYVVLGTRDFLPGKRVLLAPHAIESISWPDRKVTVAVAAEGIKNSPELEEYTSFEPDYAARLHDYYETQPRARLETVAEKTKEGISAGIEKIGEKSREILEMAKLRRQILKLQKARNEAVEQLGELVYSMYSEEAMEEDKIKAKCDLIAEMDTRLGEQRQELSKIRSGIEPRKSAV